MPRRRKPRRFAEWETLLAHAVSLQTRIPSAIEEMLRIKTFLVVERNATRDYLDVAALSHHLGLERSAGALEPMNELYAEFAGEGGSMLATAITKLAAPDPSI